MGSCIGTKPRPTDDASSNNQPASSTATPPKEEPGSSSPSTEGDLAQSKSSAEDGNPGRNSGTAKNGFITRASPATKLSFLRNMDSRGEKPTLERLDAKRFRLQAIESSFSEKGPPDSDWLNGKLSEEEYIKIIKGLNGALENSFHGYTEDAIPQGTERHSIIDESGRSYIKNLNDQYKSKKIHFVFHREGERNPYIEITFG